MNRDEFMELVYETFADEPNNVLANGIIEAADAYVEYEKAQLSQKGTTKDTTSDTISRQAAIDALERKKDKNAKGDIGGSYNKIIQNDFVTEQKRKFAKMIFVVEERRKVGKNYG